MYNHISNNIAINSDVEIKSPIGELVEINIEKIKKLLKSKQESDFKVYDEIETTLDNIADTLRNSKAFKNEFKYLILIKSEILHILYKNCEDSSFGHCDFALDLINFFKEVWEAKISLYENYSETQLKKYGELQNSFKKRYHKYREIFYYEIYEFSGEFSEEELYKIHESLRE